LQEAIQRMSRKHRLTELVGWMLVSSMVLFAFLGRARVSSHEARVAETAATMAWSGWAWSARAVEAPRPEMNRRADGSQFIPNGDGAMIIVNPWLVPVYDAQVRLQKPPLPYWFTAVAFRWCGESAAVARFLPAALGVLSCGLVYVLGRRTGGRRIAIIAGAVWASSYFVLDEHRKAMADPYLAFFTLAAIVSWIEASARLRGRGIIVLLFYVLLAAGVLAKGPVAFLHVGVAIGAFSWCFHRRPRVPLRWHLGGIALFSTIALPWPIYVVSHLPSAFELWRFESIGEFYDNRRNARPLWYYVPQLFLIAAPWTAFGIAGVSVAARRRNKMFPLIWAAALFAMFSASYMKKNAYMLPVMPAVVLIIAHGVNRIIAKDRRGPHSNRMWMLGHSIAGVAIAIVTSIAMTKTDLSGITVFVVSGVIAAVAAVPLWRGSRCRMADWFRAQAVVFALLIAVFIVFPQSARHNRKGDLQNGDQKKSSIEPTNDRSIN
jgi:4-amino-4-deoxy-L-arabinose transferase-like glycosyltransferase